MALDSSATRSSLRLLLVVAACLAATSQPSFAATVASIAAELKGKGASYVLKHYFLEPDGADGLRLVETGRADAVAMGVKMLAQSDAGSTQDIQGALAAALVKAPENVLSYVNSGPKELAANWICLPFLSAEEPDTKLRVIIARSRESLLRVSAQHLEAQKAACLREVERALARLR